VLQSRIQASARVDANGEVSWPVKHAPEVIETLAENGRLMLGPDLRRHDDDGSFYGYAWSSFDGQNVMAARDAALLALRRDDLPGDWVVITCEIA
jgi:hypothetical protein